MEIIDIKDQKLSTLIANHIICKSCNIVDRDMNRFTKGYKCPYCGIYGGSARSFFNIGILSLVDLIQEFYHYDSKENNHMLAVIIYFSSLGEVLFDKFLINLMRKYNIPESLIDKIFQDNQSIIKKMTLYKSLTGIKFNDDIIKLKQQENVDFYSTLKFYKEVREVRNVILHEAYTWIIPDDMPKQCLLNLESLLTLFIKLHNKYIADKSNENVNIN
jgi:hypothetical protein